MEIDGKKVTVMFGETILDTANRAGIYIPSLCTDVSFINHDNSCRLCVVEIIQHGKSRLDAACATTSTEDMQVFTTSEIIDRSRKTILQLIYAEAPDNPVIMNIMKKCGVEPEERIPNKGGRDCILCGRCVEVCNYWVKGSIGSMHRGINREIDTPYSKENNECLGCASCELMCPINTIELKDHEGQREIWHKKFELLHCEECGALLTTKENYYDSYYDDAPIICNPCSEEYRKKNRKNHDMYCY
jgi:NADH dehydrogenase/NADH:ubiquinone oxidoreductase subunit G